MLKVYDRQPLQPDEVNGRDVILVGKVLSTSGLQTSQTGNQYMKVILSGEVMDPEVGMPMEETITVLFFDKHSDEYGDQLNATQTSKMNIQKGSVIAIRATESEGKDQNGNDQISYFGTRASYVSNKCEVVDANGEKKNRYGGVIFRYKFSKRGDAAEVAIGQAFIGEHEGKKTLSIPVQLWDKKARENYIAYVNCNGIENITVDGTPFIDTLEKVTTDNGYEHNPVVAVAFKKLNETPDKENPDRVANMTGEIISAGNAAC
jgi:hypothetical protein